MTRLTRSVILALLAFNTLALAGSPAEASQSPSAAIPSDTPTLTQAASITPAEASSTPCTSTSVEAAKAETTGASGSTSSDKNSSPEPAKAQNAAESSAPSSSGTESTPSSSGAASTPTSSPTEAASSGADTSGKTSTDISATRTISLSEASQIAEQQAANPGSLPDDANSQSIFCQIEGWINSMTGATANGEVGGNCGNNGGTGGSTSGGGGPPVSADCGETFVPVEGDTCESIEGSRGLEKGSLIKVNGGRIDDQCFNLIAGETFCLKA